MPVNIGQVTSDVTVEPTPAAGDGPSGVAASGELKERERAARERLARDRARTSAEGFDD
jgi:hypothetical protein